MTSPSPTTATTPCRACHATISDKAEKCQYCQAMQGSWARRHPLWTALGGVVLLVVFSSAASNLHLFSSSTVPAKNTSITASAPITPPSTRTTTTTKGVSLPKPEVKVLSEKILDSTTQDYTLRLQVTNADTVALRDGGTMACVDGICEAQLLLTTPFYRVVVEASNKDQTLNQEVIIRRTATEADAQRERELAAKRAAEKQKQVMRAATKWNYIESTDEIDGSVNSSATTTSTNTIDFAFPYNGGTSFRLYVRHSNGKNEVLLSCSSCQFIGMGRYDTEQLRVRFDDNPFQYYNYFGSASYDTDLLFIDNTAQFLQSLRSAQTLKIEAPFYKEGRKVISFDVAGFSWEY